MLDGLGVGCYVLHDSRASFYLHSGRNRDVGQRGTCYTRARICVGEVCGGNSGVGGVGSRGVLRLKIRLC